jgi:hypothetical protein
MLAQPWWSAKEDVCRALRPIDGYPASRDESTSIPLRRPPYGSTHFQGRISQVFTCSAKVFLFDGDPWMDLNNPRGSYTGAMSYEHEPAGLIRKSFTPLLVVAPASFSYTPC